MKIKTSELASTALDWAVATALSQQEFNALVIGEPWEPSARWSQGGPIIERERIGLEFTGSEWWAVKFDTRLQAYGPTSLIAAMRCFVASRLGNEVDVPDESMPAA